MTRGSVAAIVRALNDAEARYLIVGGLAVVAHGYVRFTADVDLVVDLSHGNVLKVVSALEGLGYRPRAPVDFSELALPATRSAWVRNQGLTVFSLYSPEHAATEVDVFVEAPFDFDQAYERAAHHEVAPGLTASFVGLHDLIELKQRAGRPQDQVDVQQLRQLGTPRDDE